ncbi:MAG TPA: methyl-accepting chemotaxis protein [Ktedonobacteraceae bacterium]|nr:methyl-accepting chemotaxis protein [Ktedonobacteraceae bacterium]
MFKFVTNIQISRRLFYAFLLAAVIPGIVISVLGFTFINEQNNRSQAVQTNISAYKATTTAGSYLPAQIELLDVAYQNQYETRNLQAQAAQNVKDIVGTENKFDQALKEYQQKYQLATSPDMNGILSILQREDANTPLPDQQQQTLSQIANKLWPDYKAAQDRVLTAISSQAPKNQVSTLLADAHNKYTPLQTAWGQISSIADSVSNKIAQIGPSQTNPIILATIIAFLCTIIVVTAIGYAVYLTITRPLRQLATLTKRIAKGETNARAQITGRDEIYLVANSMNNMLDHIVRLIQETQSQRDTLQSQVEKLVSEVSGVGEGDLRVQAEVTADALGVLADSFNYMVEELGSLVVRVKMVAHEVENSTTAILDRMTQLVETGNRQIKQIAEAGQEVERMTSSSRQVAERSQILYDVAYIARQDAQVGRESVQQAVEGMGRINDNVHATASKVQTLGDRSREINEIVDAISSIAQQTNRLALDAAIQAAMAGENGKGFGAVAADIRRLAESAKAQAGKINRIVRSVREDIGAVAVSMQDTQRETSAGSRLTQEAGVALESIFAAVEHQAREIENINHMATQQLQSSSAVVQIMQGVSESTQQSSLSTRDASQNMERLARLVEQLRASVEAFKLRENQAYLAPNVGTSITIEEEKDMPLTVSGVFRTVSATTQPAQLTSGIASNGSLVTPTEDLFPLPPLQPENGNRPPVQPGNGNGKRRRDSMHVEERWFDSRQT